MINLDINVRGVEQIQSFLGRIPQTMRQRLVEAMAESMVALAAQVRASLPTRTGETRASVNVKIKNEGNRVTGIVFADRGSSRHAFIARFLESGTNNSAVRVRTYVRRVRSLDVHAVGKRGQQLKKLSQIGITTVKAHTRASHLPARRFFQNAYGGMANAIAARLTQAIESAVQV